MELFGFGGGEGAVEEGEVAEVSCEGCEVVDAGAEEEGFGFGGDRGDLGFDFGFGFAVEVEDGFFAVADEDEVVPGFGRDGGGAGEAFAGGVSVEEDELARVFFGVGTADTDVAAGGFFIAGGPRENR